MTVLLILFTFVLFLLIDHFKTTYEIWRQALYRQQSRRGMFTTPGFEMLGALAQDGGEPVKPEADTVENDYCI